MAPMAEGTSGAACAEGCGGWGGYGSGHHGHLGDMPQHYPYEDTMHGYYYFHPYHHAHVVAQTGVRGPLRRRSAQPLLQRFLQGGLRGVSGGAVRETRGARGCSTGDRAVPSAHEVGGHQAVASLACRGRLSAGVSSTGRSEGQATTVPHRLHSLSRSTAASTSLRRFSNTANSAMIAAPRATPEAYQIHVWCKSTAAYQRMLTMSTNRNVTPR